MENAEVAFRAVADALVQEHEAVTSGKMMSSPGIRYKNKFFAFYYQGMMVFKLGREFKPETLGIKEYNLLSPFKTKPPLVDWFQIGYSEHDKWESLAHHALHRMMGT